MIAGLVVAHARELRLLRAWSASRAIDRFARGGDRGAHRGRARATPQGAAATAKRTLRDRRGSRWQEVDGFGEPPVRGRSARSARSSTARAAPPARREPRRRDPVAWLGDPRAHRAAADGIAPQAARSEMPPAPAPPGRSTGRRGPRRARRGTRARGWSACLRVALQLPDGRKALVEAPLLAARACACPPRSWIGDRAHLRRDRALHARGGAARGAAGAHARRRRRSPEPQHRRAAAGGEGRARASARRRGLSTGCRTGCDAT